ncbi:tyrosine-type recombinase/integrase [Streptomyces sp. VTCC 41912]|uniref:tyrosine-type recombinase/integrase n=1 Tax=Streptomyces sp. VTCC 41912 TaxID=3383243 RepID=UPI003896C013
MPHIEWRGGTCRVKWWSGEYLPNGRKRYESKGGFLDEESALAYGQDQLYEIRHGTHVSNRDGATLMTDWLDDWLAAMDHAPTTERGYRSAIENHIRPYFERTTLAEIDVIAYRAFKKHVNGRVAASTAKNVMMVLGMVLDDAVPRLIKLSPVERTRRRGKFVKRKKERKRDMSALAVEQLARNAEAVFGRAGYAFVWTMAMTGMRPAELYGLTREYCYPNWPASDPRPDEEDEERYSEDMERYGKGVDLMPAIRVERQVQHHDGALRFFPPKYGSYRTLVIPPFLATMLEELLASHDRPWVFPAIGGTSLGSVNFDYWYWRQIADGRPEREGRKPRRAMPAVPPYEGRRLYLLRHGHKAWLDEDGHSKVAAEGRMGHEVPGVEGVYSSVTVPMERAVMKMLEARWLALREQLAANPLIISQLFPIKRVSDEETAGQGD